MFFQQHIQIARQHAAIEEAKRTGKAVDLPYYNMRVYPPGADGIATFGVMLALGVVPGPVS
jgi:hypothetical protein